MRQSNRQHTREAYTGYEVRSASGSEYIIQWIPANYMFMLGTSGVKMLDKTIFHSNNKKK
jgi:hypothetical protein